MCRDSRAGRDSAATWQVNEAINVVFAASGAVGTGANLETQTERLLRKFGAEKGSEAGEVGACLPLQSVIYINGVGRPQSSAREPRRSTAVPGCTHTGCTQASLSQQQESTLVLVPV